jgi:hypothetical protein
MRDVGRKHNCTKITSGQAVAIDRLLLEGIKAGPTMKRRAINKVLREVPEFTRGDCWRRIRYLRRTAKIAPVQALKQRDGELRSSKPHPSQCHRTRPWTEADDDKLLNWVGYEAVNKIAQRLNRSVSAVRFRLGALGMSAKVSDGWSLRALRKLLRASPVRLRQLIGSDMLRVRDPRVTRTSLVAFCEQNRSSLDPVAAERITAAMAKKRDAYPWEQAADLLGATVEQVQSWIAGGQLKVLDTFVSDRAFEEFCKKHGAEINTRLLDPDIAKWLIEEYGVQAPTTDCQAVSRAQKHALVVRTCKCGKKIAGNVYFKHAKACKLVEHQPLRQATYASGACGKAVAGSI